MTERTKTQEERLWDAQMAHERKVKAELHSAWLATVTAAVEARPAGLLAKCGRFEIDEESVGWGAGAAVIDMDACDVDCRGSLGTFCSSRVGRTMAALLEMAVEDGCLRDVAYTLGEISEELHPEDMDREQL